LGGNRLNNLNGQNEGLDSEWVQLVIEAKNMGIEKDEIREFLLKNTINELSIKTS
jgi:antagonist of SinR